MEVVAEGMLHYEGSDSFQHETHVVNFFTNQRVRSTSSWPQRDNAPSPWSYNHDVEDEPVLREPERVAEDDGKSVDNDIQLLYERLSTLENQVKHVTRSIVNPHGRASYKILAEVWSNATYPLLRDSQKPVIRVVRTVCRKLISN